MTTSCAELMSGDYFIYWSAVYFQMEKLNLMCFFSFFGQIKYAGSDTDFSSSPAFCKQICRVESEEQKVIGTQTPLHELLEGLIADKELPTKDKRKRLKQVRLFYFLCGALYVEYPSFVRTEVQNRKVMLLVLCFSVPEIIPRCIPQTISYRGK